MKAYEGLCTKEEWEEAVRRANDEDARVVRLSSRPSDGTTLSFVPYDRYVAVRAMCDADCIALAWLLAEPGESPVMTDGRLSEEAIESLDLKPGVPVILSEGFVGELRLM